MAFNEWRIAVLPRVNRGAALLDTVEPYWWKRIEEALLMSNCYQCVLGQVFGDYFEATERFAGGSVQDQDAWGIDHGFSADGEPWGALEELWLEAIAERKAR